MYKYALVKNGIVQTIIDTNDPNDYPDIAELLIQCSDEVRSNWTYENGVFSAPVAPIRNYGLESALDILTDKGFITEEEKNSILGLE